MQEAGRCCHCGLGAVDVHVRARSIARQLARVESDKAQGAKALVLRAGEHDRSGCRCDGPCSPDRYLDSMRIIYSALPADWTMYVEPWPQATCRADLWEAWTAEIGARCRTGRFGAAPVPQAFRGVQHF